MGGIRTGLDALEFVLAGARVSVGTVTFQRPEALRRASAASSRSPSPSAASSRCPTPSATRTARTRPPCPAVRSPRASHDVRPTPTTSSGGCRGMTGSPRSPSPSTAPTSRPSSRVGPRRLWSARLDDEGRSPDLPPRRRRRRAAREASGGRDVFLDLKLRHPEHGGGRRALGRAPGAGVPHGAHAGGGGDDPRRRRAARDAASWRSPVLTSMSGRPRGRGPAGPALDAARRLAVLAVGCRRIARSSARRRRSQPSRPGARRHRAHHARRPSGRAALGDQQRVATPSRRSPTAPTCSSSAAPSPAPTTSPRPPPPSPPRWPDGGLLTRGSAEVRSRITSGHGVPSEQVTDRHRPPGGMAPWRDRARERLRFRAITSPTPWRSVSMRLGKLAAFSAAAAAAGHRRAPRPDDRLRLHHVQGRRLNPGQFVQYKAEAPCQRRARRVRRRRRPQGSTGPARVLDAPRALPAVLRLDGRNLGLSFDYRYRFVDAPKSPSGRGLLEVRALGTPSDPTAFRWPTTTRSTTNRRHRPGPQHRRAVGGRVLGPTPRAAWASTPRSRTVFLVNWWGRKGTSRFHVFRKDRPADPDTGVNFGATRLARHDRLGRHLRAHLVLTCPRVLGPGATTGTSTTPTSTATASADYRIPPVWGTARTPTARPASSGRPRQGGPLHRAQPALHLVAAVRPAGDRAAASGKTKVVVNLFDDDQPRGALTGSKVGGSKSSGRRLEPYHSFSRDAEPARRLRQRTATAFDVWAGNDTTSKGCWDDYGTKEAALYCSLDPRRSLFLPASGKNYVGASTSGTPRTRRWATSSACSASPTTTGSTAPRALRLRVRVPDVP